jgi:hypothetical protein
MRVSLLVNKEIHINKMENTQNNQIINKELERVKTSPLLIFLSNNKNRAIIGCNKEIKLFYKVTSGYLKIVKINLINGRHYTNIKYIVYNNKINKGLGIQWL